jgi:hypothetical protein
VRTRGIILITSDKGLCGPLNTNVFKLVTDIKTPAKYAVHRPQGRPVHRPHQAGFDRGFPGQRPRLFRRNQGRRGIHG